MGSPPPEQAEWNFEQRRKTSRRSCDIEIEAWQGRSSFPATVVDLGVSGLRLRCDTPVKLKPKSLLRLTYPEVIGKSDMLTVEAFTRWTKVKESDGSMYIGVEFKDPKGLGRSWVKAKMQDLGFRPYNIRDQRTHHRVICNVSATLSLGRQNVRCLLKNVGLGGVYVELAKPIRAGAEVELKISDNQEFPDGTFNTTVRHQQHADPSSPYGYGLAFQGIGPAQIQAVKHFLTKRREAQWDQTAVRSDFYYQIAEDEADEHEEVKIPDLQSILDETEPEEEEELDNEAEAQKDRET